MSDENEPQIEPSEERPAQQQAPQGIDLKRRLRELLSIPESQRSDPVWDEIIELEIQLAPGNRIGNAPMRQGGPGPSNRGGGSGGGGGGGGGNNWKRHSGPRKHPKAGGGGGKKPPQTGGA